MVLHKIIIQKMNKICARLGNNEILKTLTLVDADTYAEDKTRALLECCSGRLKMFHDQFP